MRRAAASAVRTDVRCIEHVSTPRTAFVSSLSDGAARNRFRDINVALAENWVRGTPCVSGPNSGAMGVHFVLEERLGEGVLNAEKPEALIYEHWRMERCG